MTIAEKIRAVRLERQIPQQTVAEAAGLPTAKLCKIELGRRRVSADELVAIARALGVPVGRLCSGTVPAPTRTEAPAE